MPPITITTTLKPSDQSRTLAKLLNQVIPGSKYIKRGKNSIAQIIEKSIVIDAGHMIIVSHRGNAVDRLEFYDRVNGSYTQNSYFIKIIDFMDPRLFNVRMNNLSGPLSTSMEAREEDPELFGLLETYFKLRYDGRYQIQLMIDKKKRSSYLQFSIIKESKRFAMLRVAVKKYS